jgi:hypothetical protein
MIVRECSSLTASAGYAADEGDSKRDLEGGDLMLATLKRS